MGVVQQQFDQLKPGVAAGTDDADFCHSFSSKNSYLKTFSPMFFAQCDKGAPTPKGHQRCSRLPEYWAKNIHTQGGLQYNLLVENLFDIKHLFASGKLELHLIPLFLTDEGASHWRLERNEPFIGIGFL